MEVVIVDLTSDELRRLGMGVTNHLDRFFSGNSHLRCGVLLVAK